MDKFLIAEWDLQPSDGFGLYSTQHILVMIFAFVFIVSMRLYFKKQNQNNKDKIFKILAWILVFLECVKNVYYAYIGANQLFHLPLHLCGINVFVCLYHAYYKRDVSKDMIYLFGLVGASASLIFPAWAHFPLIAFRTMQSFSIHTLLVTYSVLVLVDYRPNYRNAKYIVYFLSALAIPVYIFNYFVGTNYMYLMAGSPGSPLKPMSDVLGAFYIPGYVLLVLLIIAIMYAPFYIKDKVRQNEIAKVKG